MKLKLILFLLLLISTYNSIALDKDKKLEVFAKIGKTSQTDDKKSTILILEGNVLIKQKPKLILQADFVKISYSNQNNKINTINATGNPVFIQDIVTKEYDTNKASLFKKGDIINIKAKNVQYNDVTQIFLIQNNAELQIGENDIKGEKIIFNQLTGEINLESSKEKNDRIELNLGILKNNKQ